MVPEVESNFTFFSFKFVVVMKTKYTILNIYCIIIFTICSLQCFSQTVGVTLNTSDSFEGYTLIAPFDNHIAYLIDNCGEIVHQWDLPEKRVRSIYLYDNGDVLYFARDSTATSSFFQKGGILKKMNWDNEILWSYTYQGADYVQHHDIEPLPNGNILLVTFKVRASDQAILKGKTSFGNDIWTTKIDEIKPIGTDSINVVWEWEVWNHLVQDVDSNIDNYAVIKDSPGKIDINYTNNDLPDLLHVNSISYNKTSDLILLSSNFYSELYVIDHSTTTAEAATSNGGNFGKGGEILYRWGNPEAYDRGTVLDKKFFRQHDAKWIENDLPYSGGIVVFHNGDGRSEINYSSVDVLMPDRNLNGEFVIDNIKPFGPLELSKSYFNAIDPSYIYAVIGSGCQILPNGNAIMCSRDQGLVVELSPENKIVWEYRNPVEPITGIATQGDLDNPNSYLWRADKYPTDYAAFIGKNLLPKGTIEFGTDTSLCSILLNTIAIENTSFDIKVYPNPTSKFISIDFNEFSKKVNNVQLLDVFGKMVYEQKINSFNENLHISVQDLKTGIYIMKIWSNEKIFSYKIAVR